MTAWITRRRASIGDGKRVLRGLLPAVCCLLMAGCVATPHQREAQRAVSDYFAGDYPRAIERLRPLARESNEDFVLNNVRLGSAALIDYDLDQAEDAFLRAYEVINSVGVNDGGRSLGAVLVDEKIRIWKGEPFERAMANFYLGLIYYMKRDYENARAAFENSLFKLRDYAGDGQRRRDDYREQESNFVVALAMLGKTWQKLGRDDLARADFQRIGDLRPDLSGLADYERSATSNLLLVIDFGYGPQKVTDFDGSIIGFAPSPEEDGRIPPPRVTIDGRPVDVSGLDEAPIDLLAMAQDRRWQSIDTIRAIKSALGTGLIAGGAATSIYGADRHHRDTAIAGLAMIGTGLLLKATSQADVRQWEMLPRTVFILPLRVPPGTHDVTVWFPFTGGLRQTWRNLEVPGDGEEATYYFRMQRDVAPTHDWPPPAWAKLSPSP